MLSAAFYETVMRELIAALGAALFVANGWALLRGKVMPPKPEEIRPTRSAAASSKKQAQLTERVGRAADGNLVRAPLGRTLLFMALGALLCIWGVASLVSAS